MYLSVATLNVRKMIHTAIEVLGSNPNGGQSFTAPKSMKSCIGSKYEKLFQWIFAPKANI